MYKIIEDANIFETDFGVEFELCFTRHFIERASERMGLSSEDAKGILLDYFDIPDVHDLIFAGVSTSELKNGLDFVLCIKEYEMLVGCFVKRFANGIVIVTKTCLPKHAKARDGERTFFIKECNERGEYSFA